MEWLSVEWLSVEWLWEWLLVEWLWKWLLVVLNIGLVLNETNEDVRMYIEDFILVDIWIHYCTKSKYGT